DLSFLDKDGHRISWLGAPTRALISARDVLSTEREGLSLSGGAPGEYVVELVRSAGFGRVRGELKLSVAGETRLIPFSFDGERQAVAVAEIRMQPRLVPLDF